MDLNDLAQNPEKIKELIGFLQALLPNDTKVPDNNTTENDDSSENGIHNIKTKSRKQIRQQSGKNKFEEMSEFRMHKEDSVIDKKLSQVPPIARMRPMELVDVVCRVCGKRETISSSLIFESPSRYKCNNCSTNAG